ncbi:MAG: magnesium transporter [Armatimonadetes bacterium]|nr:magnesium transporter [Armatimonadota bacterium]
MPENVHLAEQLRAALRTPGRGGGDLALTAATQGMRSEDIAEALRDLTNPEALAVFNWLDNAEAAEVLGDLEPDTARYILANAPPARIADLLDRLPMDDAAWVVSEAEPARAAIFMAQLQQRAPEDAEEVRELLTYEEGTAGRLMTDSFVRLAPDLSVVEAFADVRRADAEVETLSDLYVVETDGKNNETLVGVISLRELVRARDEQRIADIMTRDVISVSVDTDQEEMARQFAKYDFMAMPVLDREGFLAGIVTVDDALDVLTEEQTEDQLRFAGVSVEPGATPTPYFSTPLLQVVKSRLGWLVLLFAASQLSGEVLAAHDADFAKVAALTIFIPLLIGTGGNTGAQTVSTIIRGISLGEVRFKDIFRVLGRELLGGLLLGSLLALIGFGLVSLRGFESQLAMVVALSILAICTWANVISAAIPLVAQKFKVDPALISAPLITTLVDATGLAIYLGIAKLLITALR